MTRISYIRVVTGIIWMLAIFVCLDSLAADLTWEGHFVDEEAIVTGTSVLATNTMVRFSTTAFSDNDGGTFDLLPGRSADFFSFESGTTGNHSGYLEMSFDNQNNDPADYLELSMDFMNPVTNLQFSILDIDGSPSLLWDDGVEVFFNGVNVKTDPSLYTIGSAIFLDNEGYMDGFEAGNTSASSNQTIGNLDLDFGNLLISNITVRYLSTDDAVGDPSTQFIGISDLSFSPTAIPEPTMAKLCLLLLMMVFCNRPERRNC